jgi:hypothetical protein
MSVRCRASGEGEVGDKGVENLYVIDLTSAAKTPTPVSEGFRAAFIYVGADAGRLYFLTTLEAPNGKVIAVDPARGCAGRWRCRVRAPSPASPAVRATGRPSTA